MVFKILNTLFIGVLFLDFLDRRFPNEFRSFVLNLSFNGIYFFGVLQLFLLKTKNKLSILIESNETLLKLKNEINKLQVYFYNNNNLDNDFDEIMIENCDGYDFYIQNFKTVNKIINKQICFVDSNNPINEPCEIKFILIEFNCGDKLYKIDLKTDVFNYYLVGNKFTKDFFIYYIKNHLNNDVTFDKDEKYTIELLDHNINKVEIEFNDKDCGFILEKNDYKIIKI
jgi:hypothetical protein